MRISGRRAGGQLAVVSGQLLAVSTRPVVGCSSRRATGSCSTVTISALEDVYVMAAISSVTVIGLASVDSITHAVTNEGSTSNSSARMVVSTALGIPD